MTEGNNNPRGSIRTAILLTLYATLAIILVVGFVWVRNELKSRAEMEKLRESAGNVQDDRPVMSDVEKARFTHLDAPEGGKKKDVTTKEAEKSMLPKFKDLYEQNEDIAGWITIPGTKIDYPVMYRQGDNEYYLDHNFDGENDVNGMIFLDGRCDKSGDNINSVINGHNMKSGEMFGSLKKYGDPAYLKEHGTIKYSTLYDMRTYEIFAIFKSSVYNEDADGFQYYINIENEEQFNDYIKGAKENSLYDTGVSAEWGDRLITLLTCEYSKENGRLVVVAKEIKDQ